MQAQSSEGPVPLKRGVGHLGGRYLSPEQVREIRHMRGGAARAKVNEMIRLLRQDGLVPVDADPELRRALAELAQIIGEVLGLSPADAG